MTRPLAPPCQTTDRRTKPTRTPLALGRGAAGRGVEQIKGNGKDTNGLGFWGYTGNQTPSRALGIIHGFAGFLASVPETPAAAGSAGWQRTLDPISKEQNHGSVRGSQHTISRHNYFNNDCLIKLLPMMKLAPRRPFGETSGEMSFYCGIGCP